MNTWPKICGLCQDAIYAGEWTSLPFCGYQDDGDDGRLELRHHTCGTTLSVHVEPNGLPHTIAADLAELFRIEARDREGLPPPYTWPPKERRKVSREDMREAARLHGIADELDARVRRAVETKGWAA